MAFDDPAFQSLLNFINMFGGSREVTTQHNVTPLGRAYQGQNPNLAGPGMAGFEGDPNAVGGVPEGPSAVSLGWTSQATADKVANLIFDLMSLPIPFASVIKNATQQGTKTQDLLTTLFNPEAKGEQVSKPSFLTEIFNAIFGGGSQGATSTAGVPQGSDISAVLGNLGVPEGAMIGPPSPFGGTVEAPSLDPSVLGIGGGEGGSGGGGGGSLGGALGAGSSGAPGSEGGFGFGFGM